MEKKPNFIRHRYHHLLLLLVVLTATPPATPDDDDDAAAGDAAAMRALLKSLTNAGDILGWSESSNPCSWQRVSCEDDRVTAIYLGNRGLSGSLPPDFCNLTALTYVNLMFNNLSGPLPSLAGMTTLKTLYLNCNQFSSIPQDFFSGLHSLADVSLDHNPFAAWSIPPSLRDASGLLNFSAAGANITGSIPDFLAAEFPVLEQLSLAYNSLEGPLPSTFSGSPLRSLKLNNQKGGSGLSGRIDVIENMTKLQLLWLQSNSFSGPIPDLSRLENLHDLNLRDNQLTGPVPSSLTSLESLENITLTNNLLQGAVPVFPETMQKVDLDPSSERFCVDKVGVDCDPRVNILLSIAKSFGYPVYLANNWRGNDPCNGFTGITCDPSGNITLVVLQNLGFNGTISPDFQLLPKLRKLLLSGNNLTGTIPSELINLKYLQVLDVSRNALWGKVPRFGGNVSVNTDGNSDIGRDGRAGPPGPDSPKSGNGDDLDKDDGGSNKSLGIIMGSVAVVVFGVLFISVLGFFYCKRKKKQSQTQRTSNVVAEPQNSSSEQLKVTIEGNATDPNSVMSSGAGIVEQGSMIVSIQLLREATDNFSQDNILGQGGFGTVYKGKLHDGSMIAVKRMEAEAMGSKGLDEFTSEISVLTKVRHRHLVSLLGYCLEKNERILVYEHMPQGTLSHHLFDWMNLRLKPLEWKKRLTIALDVARGVEYLHSLANQSFIHRDLKPSNILLGDDMRAKVADFGLVRLVPEGNLSIHTRLAGTFGYLAPEYAVFGRVTTKADVYSFGVILMELISGRKAVDHTQPEENMHLATWFRQLKLNEDTFQKAIDPNINLDEETLKCIRSVAELALHCTAKNPYQRPDMAYAVNILFSLAEIWKPADGDLEDDNGINLGTTLAEMLNKWKAFEDNSQLDGTTSSSSSYVANIDHSQSSTPTRCRVFAESFTLPDA